MNKNEKLLRRLNPKDKKLVLAGINAIFAGQTAGLDIAKIDDNKFRLRKGNYRILFRCLPNGEPEIYAIRKRDEKTYRDI